MARVALVTGGTRGIGEAISIALKEAGCAVAANYGGNVERATEFSDRTGIKTYKFDVGDYEAVLDGVARVEADLGPIDILVNNAGITRDGTMHRMSYDNWDDVIRTNLSSCFNCSRASHRRHAGAQVRPHRQHRLDQRPGRPVRPGELCCRQVRYPRLHQGAGPGRRRPGHHGQRHRARLCRYRHGARRAAEGAGADHPAHPGRPPRQREATSPAASFS